MNFCHPSSGKHEPELPPRDMKGRFGMCTRLRRQRASVGQRCGCKMAGAGPKRRSGSPERVYPGHLRFRREAGRSKFQIERACWGIKFDKTSPLQQEKQNPATPNSVRRWHYQIVTDLGPLPLSSRLTIKESNGLRLEAHREGAAPSWEVRRRCTRCCTQSIPL